MLLAARLSRAARRPAARVQARWLALDHKPANPTIFEDDHLFPEHVAQEAKTDLAPGLPVVRESAIWENPDMLLPERHEYIWDDGTAEPEWFVDRGSAGGAMGGRPWAVSNYEALAQCGGMLLFIAVGVGGAAWLLDDKLRQAAPRATRDTMGEAIAFPHDMRVQCGLVDNDLRAEEEEEE